MFSAQDPFEDPICTLEADERLRVCMLVLNSEYFEEELKFIPRTVNSMDNCVKREITFQDEEARYLSGGLLYEEWMISCKPDYYYATFQNTYYLSAAYYSENHVFAYRWDENGNLILENRFGNVRFNSS